MALNDIQTETQDRTASQESRNVNYRFFVHMVTSLPNADGIRVLDYGCGQGPIVRMLRDAGVECYGVEYCYEGSSFDDLYASDLFKEGMIRVIPETGEVPFPDGYFDVIISNQVFEHVSDKRAVLHNLKRVLKDDGFMYHHFPSREVIKEGHIGIPFSHWLPRGRFRHLYTKAMRHLGFGDHTEGKTVEEWTRYGLDWIDAYCFYERYAPLHKMMSEEFLVTHHEIDYCRFRARGNRMLSSILSIKPLSRVYERMFRRLAFMAVKLRKLTV